MKIDINLQTVDIDQCSNDGWFSGTHKCHLNNSEVRMRKVEARKSGSAKSHFEIGHVCVVNAPKVLS